MAESTDSSYAKSISLPAMASFRNLENAKRFAIDIGGSLAKLAYYSEVQRKRTRTLPRRGEEAELTGSPVYEVEIVDECSARLHFVKFETRYIEMCLDFIIQECPALSPVNRSGSTKHHFKATGGGAYKYRKLLEEKLGVVVDKEDEMSCLIHGCNFLLSHIPNESYLFEKKTEDEPAVYNFCNTGPDIFPYLLVNIGSGVSILKVESNDKYQRIGGTAMGGGTFWGLGSLLTEAKGFDELLKLAERGRRRNVDMLVEDIYGGDYTALGLPADLTASSFGKTVRSSNECDSKRTFRQEDIAKSLLHLISNGIGQIAYLNACLHNLNRIYFGGYYIRGHPETMHTISFAINYWSKGEIQALFLRHEGYLGAVGAFLNGCVEGEEEHNWVEHYSGSSVPKRSSDHNLPQTSLCDVFELDRKGSRLVPLPLLASPETYQPDLIDLTNDEEARTYWIDLMEKGIEKIANFAQKSQLGVPDARERATLFLKSFQARLDTLRETPNAYGGLSIWKLLDMREQCLSEVGFVDVYAKEKQKENETALSQLSSILSSLDSLSWEERQITIVRHLLAGNMFDWGSVEVTKLIEGGTFRFADSLNRIPDRPWLNDGLDEWMKRLKEKPYKCALIFVDNSGFDIILGVMPLVVELLRMNTKVILAANSEPALNDVQHSELLVLADRVGDVVPCMRDALVNQRLVIVESGSSSPCLDLMRVNQKVCAVCEEVDLVVLEGMGRAILTNFNTKFTCDSVRVAVVKNQWIAQWLGGELFAAVFKYDNGQQQNIGRKITDGN